MKKAPEYQEYTWTIGAGESLEFSRAAEFLVCLEASAPFKITFDHGTKTNFEAGLSFKVPQGFQHIRLENQNGAAISVRLGFGRGDLRDARLVLEGSIPTEAVSAPVFDAPGPVSVPALSVIEIVPANLERRELGIKNLDGWRAVWIKDQSATGETGWPLEAGEGAVLTTSAAVYAYNNNGAAVEIAVFETKGA